MKGGALPSFTLCSLRSALSPFALFVIRSLLTAHCSPFYNLSLIVFSLQSNILDLLAKIIYIYPNFEKIMCSYKCRDYLNVAQTSKEISVRVCVISKQCSLFSRDFVIPDKQAQATGSSDFELITWLVIKSEETDG